MKTTMVFLILITVHTAYARDISRTYTEERWCGDSESYEGCRIVLETRLKKRFAAEVSGSIVEASTKTSLLNGKEAVQEEIQEYTYSRVKIAIVNGQDIRRMFFDTGGLIRIQAKLSISQRDLEHCQRILDKKQSQITRLPTPTYYEKNWARKYSDNKEKENERIAISAHVGPFQGRGFSNDAFVGVVSFESIERPVSFDFSLMTVRDAAVTNGESGVEVLSLNAMMKYLPIDTQFLRFGIGLGGGIAELKEISDNEEFKLSGSQFIGIAEITFFPSTVRLCARAYMTKTRFKEVDRVPVLKERCDIGSGMLFTGGIVVESPY
jgi:hypothetical protein